MGSLGRHQRHAPRRRHLCDTLPAGDKGDVALAQAPQDIPRTMFGAGLFMLGAE
jgi:hypothetical protein